MHANKCIRAYAAPCTFGRADFFFQSQNFESGIVYKYVILDVESESGIYFGITKVLARGVFV